MFLLLNGIRRQKIVLAIFCMSYSFYFTLINKIKVIFSIVLYPFGGGGSDELVNIVLYLYRLLKYMWCCTVHVLGVFLDTFISCFPVLFFLRKFQIHKTVLLYSYCFFKVLF